MPQISRLYSPIRVLTAPIVTQVHHCPFHYTGRVNNNPCPSLLVTMLRGFFLESCFYLLPPIIYTQSSYSKEKSLG